MWDAWSTEALYRTEQIRRARSLDPDHHQSRDCRGRSFRRTRRAAAADRGTAQQ